MKTPFLKKLALVLLVAASVGWSGFAISSIGWYRAATVSPHLDELDSADRSRLTQELLTSSPAVHSWAWFEPGIGYTLAPDSRVEAFGDVFRTNALGYRAPPAQKRRGATRIVFIGDSWTFGMGVREDQAFPRVLERRASLHGQEVEAWTLALPGYNTLNELSAFWYFFDRLQPDIVVLTLSTNDNHSSSQVLPNGSLTREGVSRDRFGDPHSVVYRPRVVRSHRYRERWLQCLEGIREAERKLAKRSIPLLLFFLARWAPSDAHSLVAAGGLQARYLVAPAKLTLEEWANPPPWRHGTAEAHELYAQMVHQALAGHLGLQAPEDLDERARVPVFTSPPPGYDGTRLFPETEALDADSIGERFEAGSPISQVAGPLGRNGAMGRATTILVRFFTPTTALRVTVRPLQDMPSLYPQSLSISIPSPDGGTRTALEITARGRQAVDLPIPTDLDPGSVLDVVFEAERTAASLRGIYPRSLVIDSIEPVDGSSGSGF